MEEITTKTKTMTQTFEQWWDDLRNKCDFGVKETARMAWNAAVASQSANCEPKHEHAWCFDVRADGLYEQQKCECGEIRIVDLRGCEGETGTIGTHITYDEPAVYKKKSINLEEETYKRPPLGLVPRFVREEVRLQEVCDAIKRYEEANVKVPIEWLFERDELMGSISESRKKLCNTSDIGAILEDVAEKVQGINGKIDLDVTYEERVDLEAHNQNANATERTTQLKWVEVSDTQNTNGYTKKVLKQYHRYLNKEGGEWRDVPTV